jgi:diadenosine tetraphosphate (Ap4A) HIT family hydrolase
MENQNCAYCAEGELVEAFGIKICELDTCKVYLFKEQSHRGRIIAAHKKHVGDLTQLSAEERSAYFEEIAQLSRVLQNVFQPDKVNYGAYGDTGHHLHFHLVPKYKEAYEWGGVFAMNPKEVFLTDEEYGELIKQIKKEL